MKVVILGGSLSGLLAANAIASDKVQVTVLEKDSFDDCQSVFGRGGVPHDAQGHGLLGKGNENLNTLIPNFQEQLLENGAVEFDRTADIKWYREGWKVQFQSGVNAIGFTRPVMEKTVRKSVQGNKNVKFQYDARVMDYQVADDRITGVRLNNNEVINGDLIIDAMGRTTPTLKWFKRFGFQVPEITIVNIDLVYTTSICKVNNNFELPSKSIYIFPSPKVKKGGVYYVLDSKAVANGVPEDKYILVAIFGYHDEKPQCKTFEDVINYTQSFPEPSIASVLKNCTLFTSVKPFPIPSQTWNRYDQLNSGDFPKGFLAIGDSVCSLDPLFGQGMTNVSNHCLLMKSINLEHYVSTGDFFTIQKKIGASVWLPFMMNTIEDHKYEATTGFDIPGSFLARKVLNKLFELARQDPEIFAAILRVAHLESSPLSLLWIGTVARIIYRTTIA